jgi:tetratricopeptide (TPR) repeat protein
MYLQGRPLRLRKTGRRSNPARVVFLVGLIFGGLLLLALRTQQGRVQPLFQPTAEPTRIPQSYADEAEAQFAAGDMKAAIKAYQNATRAAPKNLDYAVALARIQIFANQDQAALTTAQDTLLIAPNDPKVRAIYAWALDWNVSAGCHCTTLAQAEAAAVQAIALDGNYAPAHAYYSEILNDSGKWQQGYLEAETAARLAPNLLESERALGYANESVGNYQAAIDHYKAALKINPNLISLYLALGLNYRVLNNYDEAVYYFSKATAIDPSNVDPFLYLSRTYYQNDELGTAIQYLNEALQLEPANPDIHGRLGLILFKRRNYEGAEPELRLAVLGGVVDSKGNPLLDDLGNPLNDSSGKPVTPIGATLQVAALPLDGAVTLEYYYTYGNLLAFLNKCGPNQAPKILQLALNFRPDDPTVKGSYDESMAICNGTVTQVATATSVAAATPIARATPVATSGASAPGQAAAKATFRPALPATAGTGVPGQAAARPTPRPAPTATATP